MRRPSFRRSLATQIRVIGALMIREAMSRYGHEDLGFFWLMGEPLILSSGVAVLWTFLGQTHGFNIDVIPFALTGYSILTMWRMHVFRSTRAMRQSVSLVFHANIQFFDVLLARGLLETIGILAAFFIAYTPLALLGYMYPIRDPLILFGAWFLTAWFSFGVGLVVAGLSELSDAVERFVHPLMYFTLPLTGAFYMVYWLPERIRDLALLSPLVNGSEMFRAGVFPASIPTHYSVLYMLGWCIGTTAVGLMVAFYGQHHVRFE